MQKNEVKLKLIEVGARLILEKGYHGAGIMEILTAAGVPKGSFYYYFKSKEDFCVAIIKNFVTQYSEKRLALLYDQSVSARDRLCSFLTIERDSYHEQDCPLGCLGVKLIMEMSRLSESIRTELQSAVATWVKGISACLTDGVAGHEFQLTQAPDITAELINSLWIGAITRVIADQSVSSMTNIIEYIMHQICQPI